MNLAEGWVRECYHCGGVEMGPPLDDGVMAIEEEHASWSCMNCHNERDFDDMEPYTEVRIWGVSDSLFMRKARNKDYESFMDWVAEQPNNPEEA